jgi:hypothetical protein
MAQSDIQLTGDSQNKFWGIAATDRSWRSDGVNDSADLSLLNGQPFSYWINKSKPVTLSAYIKANANSQASPFYFSQLDNINGIVNFYFGIGTFGSGYINFGFFNNGSLFRKLWFINIVPNYWYHILATYDGSTNTNGIKIYIDGQDLEEITPPSLISNINPTNTTLVNFPNRMGFDYSSGNFFNASFANVCIWDSILNAEEIAHVANKRQNIDFEPAIVAKLVEQWSCNQNTNTNIINATLNPANNMIITGQPTNDFPTYY